MSVLLRSERLQRPVPANADEPCGSPGHGAHGRGSEVCRRNGRGCSRCGGLPRGQWGSGVCGQAPASISIVDGCRVMAGRREAATCSGPPGAFGQCASPPSPPGLLSAVPSPGYLSCCRFLNDSQIVTSSGDTTW